MADAYDHPNGSRECSTCRRNRRNGPQPEPDSWWRNPVWWMPGKARPTNAPFWVKKTQSVYKTYHLWVHPECRPLLGENGRGEPQLGDPQEPTAHNALASTFGEYGPDYAPLVET